MTSLIFPDINVWLALNHPRHIHNEAAMRWYESLDASSVFVFCRLTQLGLFRLMSTNAVMRQETLTQAECWQIYNRWVDSRVALLAQDPAGLDSSLQRATSGHMVAPKAWTDDYLAAFAETAKLRLVTFDKALAAKAKGALLLS